MNITVPNTIPMNAGRMDPPWKLRVFMPEALQFQGHNRGWQNISGNGCFRLAANYGPRAGRTNLIGDRKRNRSCDDVLRGSRATRRALCPLQDTLFEDRTEPDRARFARRSAVTACAAAR